MTISRQALESLIDPHWQRLADQIDFANRFWLGFILTSSPAIEKEFRRRAEAWFVQQKQKLLFVTISWRDRDAIAEIPARLQQDPRVAEAACIWIRSLEWDTPGSSSWQDAWSRGCMQLNQQRNALRRDIRGGIVFALPPPAKIVFREAAPDFWSIRDIVFELQEPPDEKDLDPTEDRTHLARAQEIIDIALEEADRIRLKLEEDQRLARVHSLAANLINAAETLLADKDAKHARQTAREAVELLEADKTESVLPLSRSLAALGEAERLLGNTHDAEKHLDRALLLRRDAGQLATVPLPWFVTAGKLALMRKDTDRALAVYAMALQSIRLQKQQGPESLIWSRNVARICMRIAEVHVERREFDEAKDVATQAVLVARNAVENAPTNPDARVALTELLVDLGEIQRRCGDHVSAKASFREAVELGRESVEAAGDDLEKQWALSFALNRWGESLADAQELDDALAAYSEAVDIRRRIYMEQAQNEMAAKDLSSALRKVAKTHQALGDRTGAYGCLCESIAIDEKRCRQFGQSDAGALRTLASSYRQAAELATNPEDALELANHGVEIAARLDQTNDPSRN